jgi:hypothetical protein
MDIPSSIRFLKRRGMRRTRVNMTNWPTMTARPARRQRGAQSPCKRWSRRGVSSPLHTGEWLSTLSRYVLMASAEVEARHAAAYLAIESRNGEGPKSRRSHHPRADNAAKTDPAEVPGSLIVEMACDVTPAAIRWLWPGYVPLGKLSVIEGDPGLGKSLLTVQLAAAVTTGMSLTLPGWERRPAADVVFVTYEDGNADTNVPRLIAAGADLFRVAFVKGVRGHDGFADLFTVPGSIPQLKALVTERHAALVVIDPLSASLGSDIDSYKDQDIRRALAPVAHMADDTGAAFHVVRHLAKAASRRAILSGGASIGISGAARTVLTVGHAEDDATHRILAVVKCNVAVMAPSLIYSVVANAEGQPVVEWHGSSTVTADDLAASRGDEPGGRNGGACDEVEGCLREWLIANPMSRKDVFALADHAGFAHRTVDRAAEKLGVVKSHNGFGPARVSMWSLPTAPSAPRSPSPPVHATYNTVAEMGVLAEMDSAATLSRLGSAPTFDTAEDV